ncbi:MAG: hypothetical protein SGPRY_011446 [Prymnesium sp.]
MTTPTSLKLHLALRCRQAQLPVTASLYWGFDSEDDELYVCASMGCTAGQLDPGIAADGDGGAVPAAPSIAHAEIPGAMAKTEGAEPLGTGLFSDVFHATLASVRPQAGCVAQVSVGVVERLYRRLLVNSLRAGRGFVGVPSAGDGVFSRLILRNVGWRGRLRKALVYPPTQIVRTSDSGVDAPAPAFGPGVSLCRDSDCRTWDNFAPPSFLFSPVTSSDFPPPEWLLAVSLHASSALSASLAAGAVLLGAQCLTRLWPGMVFLFPFVHPGEAVVSVPPSLPGIKIVGRSFSAALRAVDALPVDLSLSARDVRGELTRVDAVVRTVVNLPDGDHCVREVLVSDSFQLALCSCEYMSQFGFAALLLETGAVSSVARLPVVWSLSSTVHTVSSRRAEFRLLPIRVLPLRWAWTLTCVGCPCLTRVSRVGRRRSLAVSVRALPRGPLRRLPGQS